MRISENCRNNLISSVKEDYKNKIDYIIPEYPIKMIFSNIHLPEDKTLFIDGENAEYHPSLRSSPNIYNVFISWCIKHNYNKLIIICKNPKYWKNIDNTSIRDTNIDIYIIHTSAIGSIPRRINQRITINKDMIDDPNSQYCYPHDLRSYDDCLLIGLLLENLNNNLKNIKFYTRDKQMFNDYLRERTIILPFTVSIYKYHLNNFENNKKYLFQPHTEEIFMNTDKYNIGGEYYNKIGSLLLNNIYYDDYIIDEFLDFNSL
jgi:hypothetical protein